MCDGTANTNQMLMAFMGLHLPGTSVVKPGTPLRDARTAQADLSASEEGVGRALFAAFRAHVGPAESGAAVVAPTQAATKPRCPPRGAARGHRAKLSSNRSEDGISPGEQEKPA